MIPKQLLYNLLKLYLKMNESEQYDVSILTEADMSEITLNSIKQ